MQLAKHYHPGTPAHRLSETAVWAMVIALLGLVSYAMLSLWDRVGG
jgi:hypothetical protein